MREKGMQLKGFHKHRGYSGVLYETDDLLDQIIDKLASKRALMTAKGLRMNPTVVLAVAPASRFPVPVSLGRTDAC